MSLFNSYGDFNKIQDYGRVVTYSAEPVSWENSVLESKVIYWKLTRNSKTRFGYFGMTHAAAEQCKSEMIAKYTRSYMRWEVRLSEYEKDYPDVFIKMLNSVECGSGIEPYKIAGDDWGVDCQIDETDEIISLEQPKTKEDFDSLFQSAELRDSQDDGTNGISVEYANWSRAQASIKAVFTYNITNYDSTKLSVQIWNGSAWTAATSVVVDGHSVTFSAATNKTFRLNYNSLQYVSKSYTTRDLPNYATILSDLRVRSIEIGAVYAQGSSIMVAIDGYLETEDPKFSYYKYWGADVSIDGKLYEIKGINLAYRRYNETTNRSVYFFDTGPFGLLSDPSRPILGAQISIFPCGESRGVMSNPYTANEQDYINVISASISGGTVTAVFETNLLQANLESNVYGFINMRGQAVTSTASVTYQSLGNSRYSATFANGSGRGTFDWAFIQGANSAGEKVSSNPVLWNSGEST